MAQRFCSQCGAEIPEGAQFCPKCGAKVGGAATAKAEVTPINQSGKSRGTALILCALGFGCVAGIHRFYVGKIGTGLLWLFTGGLLGIGTLVDAIVILCGTFKDVDGNIVYRWSFD
jgi:TM2 domain-containing membrane protein YozV